MRLRGKIGTALFMVALLGGILLGATWKVGQSTYTIGDDMTSVGGVRKDVRAALADGDGEYTLPQFTALGDMRTKDEDLNATVGGAEDELDGTTTDGPLAAVAGGTVTFQVPVAIAQGAAGRTTILALDAGKVIYLHALVLTMDVAGTVKVCYDDDGAGTNEVDLTGAFPAAATGGFVIPFTAQKDGCVRTASGKQLTLFTTAGKAFGYAVVSKE